MSEAKGAAKRLSNIAQRCTILSTLESEIFLDSRDPADRWGQGFFATVEEEYRYRTFAIAREARQYFGSPSHEAFAQLSASFPHVQGVLGAAWRVGNAVPFVYLRRLPERTKRGGAHFDVVLGASYLPDESKPDRTPALGWDEIRAALFLPSPDVAPTADRSPRG